MIDAGRIGGSNMQSAGRRLTGLLAVIALLGCRQAAPSMLQQSLTPDKAAPVSHKVDVSQPGTYSAGLWKYTLTITAPGTRSEGTLGTLLYNGKPVPAAVEGDYYRTPWGDVQWVGDPVVLWGEHGWMLRPPGGTGGRLLPEPWPMVGGPVVMAAVFADADALPADDVTLPWIRDEMGKLGVAAWRMEHRWFALNDQAATIHDTKMVGTLTVRLSPAYEKDRLTVQLGGTEAERVDLPRTDGATALVRKRMGVVRPQTFYLAFRVDRAAPDWPVPLRVGPDADGTTVAVEGVREVVIRLPGDSRSGLVWTVREVRGDGLLTSSVTYTGWPQFVPGASAEAERAGTGHVENVFRVVDTGKTDIVLEHRRPWQADQPAEKAFKVTLDVRSVPEAARP